MALTMATEKELYGATDPEEERLRAEARTEAACDADDEELGARPGLRESILYLQDQLTREHQLEMVMAERYGLPSPSPKKATDSRTLKLARLMRRASRSCDRRSDTLPLPDRLETHRSWASVQTLSEQRERRTQRQLAERCRIEGLPRCDS